MEVRLRLKLESCQGAVGKLHGWPSAKPDLIFSLLRGQERRAPHLSSSTTNTATTSALTPATIQSNDSQIIPRTVVMSNHQRSQPSASSRLSTMPSQKPRQLSHLQAQLAQLTANMADLESLMRMTAGQAQDMRGLGGYAGAM